MKRRVKKPDATEIILGDKELTLIIRRMIQEAIQKGYCKTSVMKVISSIWRDMVPKKERTMMEPSAEEQIFFDKVDKFYEEYGIAFVTRACWIKCDFSWQNKEKINQMVNNPEFARIVLDSLRMFTKSVYCTFCREESFTREKIKKYSYELFGYKKMLYSNLYGTKCALDDLYLFGEERPIYIIESEELAKYQNIFSYTIDANESYREFVAKYSYKKTDLTRVAMELIWLIDTYC